MSLIGRIGSDPEVKVNKNGKQFLVYKVATSDPYIPPKEGGTSPFFIPPPSFARPPDDRAESREGDPRAR